MALFFFIRCSSDTLCTLPPSSKHFSSIRNNSSFRQKHTGVLDGSDSSDGTLYPLMEIYALPFAQAMGHVAYISPSLCCCNVVTCTHHQNKTCVTLFTGAAVMLLPGTQRLAMCMPCFDHVLHHTSPQGLYIRCRTLRMYV